MTAEEAFGKFMRTLRKTSRNGVLFTMCMDLVSSFEGEKLVFETPSETVFRALNRPEHIKSMEEALSLLGISEFEVRKSAASPKEQDAVEALKKNFGDYPVEIK